MTSTTVRITIAIAVMFALTMGTGFAVADGGKHSVNTCKKYKYKVFHKPPGNPGNVQVIYVGSKSAALAHKHNHGDYFKKVCVKHHR